MREKERRTGGAQKKGRRRKAEREDKRGRRGGQEKLKWRMIEAEEEKQRGEESSDHRQSVIREIKAELKVQLAKKKKDNANGEGIVFSKKKAKFMGDLMRSVTSAEAALGLPQLRNCQQLLRSVCILTGLSAQSSKSSACTKLPKYHASLLQSRERPRKRSMPCLPKPSMTSCSVM